MRTLPPSYPRIWIKTKPDRGQPNFVLIASLVEQGKQICQVKSTALGGDHNIHLGMQVMQELGQLYVAGSVEVEGLSTKRDELLRERGLGYKVKVAGKVSQHDEQPVTAAASATDSTPGMKKPAAAKAPAAKKRPAAAEAAATSAAAEPPATAAPPAASTAGKDTAAAAAAAPAATETKQKRGKQSGKQAKKQRTTTTAATGNTDAAAPTLDDPDRAAAATAAAAAPSSPARPAQEWTPTSILESAPDLQRDMDMPDPPLSLMEEML
eukprot:13594418-Alexandrium_andersonii.AAC.1